MQFRLSGLTSLALAITLAALAVLFKQFSKVPSLFTPTTRSNMSTTGTGDLATMQAKWRAQLDALPSNPDSIPSFFFGHGSPMLAFPENTRAVFGGPAMFQWAGPHGPLATFLKDFGPALLKKYKPKAIVVFSAHWETYGERIGMQSSKLYRGLYSPGSSD